MPPLCLSLKKSGWSWKFRHQSESVEIQEVSVSFLIFFFFFRYNNSFIFLRFFDKLNLRPVSVSSVSLSSTFSKMSFGKSGWLPPKPLSYCFEEIIGFDIKVSLACRPEKKRLFIFTWLSKDRKFLPTKIFTDEVSIGKVSKYGRTFCFLFLFVCFVYFFKKIYNFSRRNLSRWWSSPIFWYLRSTDYFTVGRIQDPWYVFARQNI